MMSGEVTFCRRLKLVEFLERSVYCLNGGGLNGRCFGVEIGSRVV